MPIPDTPYTRKEAYLNAVATGDSSGIPETPYTREEMYLDAIARNGGGGGGGGSSTLSGLTDVDISNPTDGQTLVYNATSGKWENGSAGVMVIHNDVDNDVLDKTAGEIYEAYASGQPCMIVESETAENPDSEERYERYSILIFATKGEFDYPPDPTSYSYEFRTRNKSWGANSPTDYPTAAY